MREEVHLLEIQGERFTLLPEKDYLQHRNRAGGSEEGTAVRGATAEPSTSSFCGEDLKAVRKTAGLSQAELGARMGKSQGVISAAERGVIQVGPCMLKAAQTACGLLKSSEPPLPSKSSKRSSKVSKRRR